MNLALFIIGLILGLASFVGLIFALVKFCKAGTLGGTTPKVEGKFKFVFLALVIGTGLFTIMSSYGIAVAGGWLTQAEPMTGLEHFLLTAGSYLFSFSICLIVASFGLYYYRPDLDVKQRKVARILTFVAIPLIVIGAWMFTDGIARFLAYPLVNGISFTQGFVAPLNNGIFPKDSSFTVKFYGILIVSGAMICYFICDHKFYQKYKKHGLLDTILLICLPAGILGGRLWYCTILEPSNLPNFWNFQDGGLAIQGGALGGIIAGAIAMIVFRRYVNLRWAMDIIMPTILLAQVLGRWGNFFNIEVHGNAIAATDLWFLPRVVVNNLHYSSTAGTASEGMVYLPLFLIEGVINLAGYFIIRFAIGKTLKKWLPLGSLGMLYVTWYGLVRVLLEPLRYGYQAGSGYGYDQSYITAWVMFGIGLLGIGAFYLYDLIRKKKGLPPKNLDTI